ncbi:MAG: hypothetical protein MO852_17665 [Candidatus Devosia euplotis]|nr:hypothetical protein [Candidatus Devosia euplotis]
MADIKQKWPWPANVGTLETFPEEVHEQKKLEKNPAASPMPELAPEQLLTPKRSSDNLRMGEPATVYPEGQAPVALTLTHVVLRRVLLKRRRRGWLLFGEAVEDEELDDLPSSRRDQMRAMLRRENAMLQLLERYNGLAEMVYSRLIGEAKG